VSTFVLTKLTPSKFNPIISFGIYLGIITSVTSNLFISLYFFIYSLNFNVNKFQSILIKFFCDTDGI
jgi:hypothetical protein